MIFNIFHTRPARNGTKQSSSSCNGCNLRAWLVKMGTNSFKCDLGNHDGIVFDHCPHFNIRSIMPQDSGLHSDSTIDRTVSGTGRMDAQSPITDTADRAYSKIFVSSRLQSRNTMYTYVLNGSSTSPHISAFPFRVGQKLPRYEVDSPARPINPRHGELENRRNQ